MPPRNGDDPAMAGRRGLRRAASVVVLLASVVLPACSWAAPATQDDPTELTEVTLSDVGTRAAHTATTLPDGRILVAGGCVVDGCSEATAATILIEADGERARPGADMAVPRTSHTATALADGGVLVIGGFRGENAGVTDSVEILHAESNSSRPLDPLNVARGGHATVLLHDGRVLVVGGWVASRTYTAEVELLDPVTGTAADAAALPWAADALEATRLADGRVLVTGGQIAPARATARAAVFDPITGTWAEVGPMSTPRLKHVGVALEDGRVLIAGGTPDDDSLLSTTELFDPAHGTFTPGPSMLEPRYKLPAGALVVDGTHVLLASGGRTAEMLDLAAGTTRQISELDGRASFATVSRLRDDRVLVLGGYDERIALRPRAVILDVDAD